MSSSQITSRSLRATPRSRGCGRRGRPCPAARSTRSAHGVSRARTASGAAIGGAVEHEHDLHAPGREALGGERAQGRQELRPCGRARRARTETAGGSAASVTRGPARRRRGGLDRRRGEVLQRAAPAPGAERDPARLHGRAAARGRGRGRCGSGRGRAAGSSGGRTTTTAAARPGRGGGRASPPRARRGRSCSPRAWRRAARARAGGGARRPGTASSARAGRVSISR